jgi:hypothetical protein
LFLLVPAEGIEPPTFGLQNRCSTAELSRRRGTASSVSIERQTADFMDFATEAATGFRKDHSRNLQNSAMINRSGQTSRGVSVFKAKPTPNPRQRLAQAAILLLSVCALSTSGFAAGTPEQRHACRKDAFRVCHDAIPNVSRVTACMQKNIAKLSPPCRAQFK